MDFHEASEVELTEFEGAVDAFVDGIWLPKGDYSEAVYQVLTTAEDMPRCILTSPDLKVTRQADDQALLLLFVHLDMAKFALRHLLERLDRLSRSRNAPHPAPVEGDAYEKIGGAFYAFGDYHVVCHALTGYRAGHSRALIDTTGMRLRFSHKPRHGGYDALTLCLAGTSSPGSSPLLVWMTWARFSESRPQLLTEIAATAHVSRHERISYRLNLELALRLATLLNNPERDVPESWRFPWGDADTIRRLLFALQVRCIYHLCAIHFTAEKHSIQGCGVDDILLILSSGTLVQELHKISGLALPLVVPFVKALTFGHGTTSPDPALQPLVTLNAGSLAVPCILVTSSRSGRNLLSLHARMDRRSFDAQSAVFEREMLERLKAPLQGKFLCVRVNVQLPKGLGGEELDLLVIDMRSLTIFLGEARAMITPADPLEVYRRLADMEKKVGQLHRKVDSIRQNLSGVLAWIGLNVADQSRWEIVGSVIVAGHGGVLSEEPSFPIVPELVFLKGIASISSLRVLHAWLAGLTWLPQSDLHFKTQPTQHIFGERIVEYSSFSDARPGEWLNTYLPATIAG